MYNKEDMDSSKNAVKEHYIQISDKFIDLDKFIGETTFMIENCKKEILSLTKTRDELRKEREESPDNFTKKDAEKLNYAEGMLEILKKSVFKYNKNLIYTIEDKIDTWKNSDSEYNKYQEIFFEFGFAPRNLGKHPAIFITFHRMPEYSGGIDSINLFNTIKLSISNAFKEHLYLYRKQLLTCLSDFGQSNYDSNMRNWKLKMNLEELIDQSYPNYRETDAYKNLLKFGRLCFNDGVKAEEFDVVASIEFLSMLLYNHFGKKSFIIIDEYDTPLISSMGKDYYNKALKLFREFYNYSTNMNKYVHKSIVAGITRIAQTNINSGMNHFIEFGLLDKKFSAYFGFTEKEVDALLGEKLIQKTNEEKNNYKEKIKEWYNGYNITVII